MLGDRPVDRAGGARAGVGTDARAGVGTDARADAVAHDLDDARLNAAAAVLVVVAARAV